jgi:hypothetical protein
MALTKGDRRAWLIIAVTFPNVFFIKFINGPNSAVAGILFPFLLKHFGWTHAKLSLLQSILGLMQVSARPWPAG